MTVGKENSDDQFPVGMRVLAVDDDSTCLKLLETMLLRCKYHVTTTTQAVIALELLRKNKDQFDLVISDVHMPDMDGFKLLELVGLEMDLPVIMLSANGETQAVMKGITHGACDYLLKPVRMEQLKNIWQHVVRRRNFDSRKHNNADDGEADQGWKLVNTENNKGIANRDRRNAKKSREEFEDDGDDDSDDNSNENVEDSGTQKKARVVWSPELHRKFVAAVNHLGIDKAVPKKILDYMNVENITRENVASHLQKYRLYLKRLSAEASRQANLAAALGGRNTPYISMNSLESFKNYHAMGRYHQMQTVNPPQPTSIVTKMNSPSAFGTNHLLPSQSIHIGHSQNNLDTSMKSLVKFESTSLGGLDQGRLLKGAPVLFQGANKSFPTGPSGNSFANITNGSQLQPSSTMLLQTNDASVRGPSLSADPFNTYTGGSSQFPDLGRCNNALQSAVSSKFPTNPAPACDLLDHKDFTPRLGGNISSAALQANGNNIGKTQTGFAMASGESLGKNVLQNHVPSFGSGNMAPITGFDQEAASLSFGSIPNSTQSSNGQNQCHMLNANVGFNPPISSALPNLRVDSSVLQRQILDSSTANNSMVATGMWGQPTVGTLHLQDSRSGRAVNSDQLGFNNDFAFGTRKLQTGLSGGLDDIVEMFNKQDRDDAVPFVEGDWELVSLP